MRIVNLVNAVLGSLVILLNIPFILSGKDILLHSVLIAMILPGMILAWIAYHRNIVEKGKFNNE